MTATLTKLGIDQMSVEERIALIEAIWDSISSPISLTEMQKQEVERRLAAHRADPSKVTPWEVIKSEALARMKQ